MKTRLLNHSKIIPTNEDIWLETVNSTSNRRVENTLLPITLPNILKSKDDPTTKPHLRADFLTYWRIPKGTHKDPFEQDPAEELIQCAIENSQRTVVEVRMTGTDAVSRLYRVGKKKKNDNDTQELVQWQAAYSIEVFSNEVMQTNDVLRICSQFIKRESRRLPEGYYLHELTEFAIPLNTDQK